MDKLLGAFLYLRARLSEPSTHAAISAICANIGFTYPATTIGNILTVASVGFGVLGFWFKEAKPITTVE
jgi:hypothetical protein